MGEEGEEKCDNVGCWEGEIAPVAAQVPVVTGEFAEDNFESPTCDKKTPNNFDNEYMNWADGHGVSYLAWAWVSLTQEEIEEEECSAFYLITDYDSYSPANPNGTPVHDHLVALKAAGGGGAGGGGTGGGSNTPPPAPAPGPGAKQGTISVLKFATKGATDGKTVSFMIDAGQACNGTIAGQSAKPLALGGKKPKKLALGSVNFALAAGKTTKVSLKLSGAARQALAKGSVKANFAVTLSSPGSATTTQSLSTTLKKAVKKHHR
jgi:hypothetical protein